MQVGISTASFFAKCMVEETPRHIARMGATLCEVFLNTFCEYEEPILGELKRNIKAEGLDAFSVHPMGTQFEPQLFSLHPRQRADAMDVFVRVLRCARELGAKYYILHGPANLHGALRNMEFNRVGPIVRELCDIAREYGVFVAWENVSWCLYHWPDFALRLTDAAKTDRLRFTFDIKQAARSGAPVLSYLEALKPLGPGKLVNVHACDYRMVDGRAVPAMPGQGECDFSAIARTLHDMDYVGPVMLEVYSDLYDDVGQIQESYRYLTQIFSSPM